MRGAPFSLQPFGAYRGLRASLDLRGRLATVSGSIWRASARRQNLYAAEMRFERHDHAPELVFGVLFDGEVSRFRALENSSGVGPYLLIQAPEDGRITHQPAAFGEPAGGINRRHCVASRKRDNLLTPSDEERVRDHEQCFSRWTMMPKATSISPSAWAVSTWRRSPRASAAACVCNV